MQQNISRQSNDATLTELGTNYQYILSLEECVNLNKGEKILIEVFGDISKESSEDSKQMEVKHHVGKHYLSERHPDLWKSLKNWVENYSSSNKFKTLVLYTTSEIINTSPLFKWNDTTVVKKLKILHDIGLEKKDRETGFRAYYDFLFAKENKNNLRNLLERIKICSSNSRIDLALMRLKAHSFLKAIPEENKDSCINTLLGYIFNTGITPPFRKEITCEEFEKYWQGIASKFVVGLRPIPDTYANSKPDPCSIKSLTSRPFVSQIQKIKYESEIPRAITNYWRTNLTLTEYCSNLYIFEKDLIAYKEDLLDTYGYKYDYFWDNLEDATAILKASRNLYREIMSLPPRPFGTISENKDFFQRGMYHNLVDEGQVKWLLEKKDEEDEDE